MSDAAVMAFQRTLPYRPTWKMGTGKQKFVPTVRSPWRHPFGCSADLKPSETADQ
jgi:hypothetical protein